MLEALNEGVVAIDANQRIIHINSSALTLFSLEESPIGKNLFDIDSLMQTWPFANPELNRRDDPASTIEIHGRILGTPLSDPQPWYSPLCYSDPQAAKFQPLMQANHGLKAKNGCIRLK